MNATYEEWLDSVTKSMIQEDPSFVLPDEMELQSLWYQGAFGLEFETTEGDPVKIEYLGEWNHSAGPDFRECLVSIKGEQYKGAIELDLTPQHWELHGHSTNRNFDNVILHVSFSPQSYQSYIKTSSYQEVPQVHIDETTLHQALGTDQSLVANTIPGFCADEFSEWSGHEIDALLRAAAEFRIRHKSVIVARQIQAIGLRETLWQALATTLGYRPNQQTMRLLSQRIKAQTLLSLPDEHSRIAILLGTAGFLTPRLYQDAAQETQRYLKSLWGEWWRYRGRFELAPDRRISWQLGGQRPVNHPHRRVASLALLLPALSDLLLLAKAPTAQRFKEIHDRITSREDPFWSRHYTLTSGESKYALKLFGADKFKELMNNFLIPIWYLRDQQGAMNYYTNLRPPAPNIQVKRALGRLFPRHPATPEISRYSYQHQGLQQLYRDFCLHHGCLRCPFPKMKSYVYHD